MKNGKWKIAHQATDNRTRGTTNLSGNTDRKFPRQTVAWLRMSISIASKRPKMLKDWYYILLSHSIDYWIGVSIFRIKVHNLDIKRQRGELSHGSKQF